MIVGEAPGRKEVEEGRPFVGKSGKLLDTVLRAVGVSRDEVYVTNVVKELPLDSEGKIRKPYPEEIEAWKEILEGEIQSTAPVAILALGRTAFEALTGASGDFAWAGSKIENVYGAWHPAYQLRRGGLWTGGVSRQNDWLEQIRPWAEVFRA
jgi:uracil-DNA glycosylase family 4